jgi:hypothetical protein
MFDDDDYDDDDGDDDDKVMAFLGMGGYVLIVLVLAGWIPFASDLPSSGGEGCLGIGIGLSLGWDIWADRRGYIATVGRHQA